MSDETPQAWVGCLACYNEGILKGEWVDGDEAGDFTPCQIPGHEEWWVFDHQDYYGLLEGECSPMEAQRKAELIKLIIGLSQPVVAVVAWAKNTYSHGVDDLDEDFESSFLDDYMGEFDSEKDYAINYAEEMGVLRKTEEWPYNHIDWDDAAQELFQDLWSVEAPGGGIYVFHN